MKESTSNGVDPNRSGLHRADLSPAATPAGDLSGTLISELRGCLSEDLLTQAADCWTYGYDNSRRHNPPQAVAFPVSHDEVLQVLRVCNKYVLPVLARGHGTGTTGAVVPVQRGLVLSLERFNRILRIDPDNRLMVVEPGVTNQQVQEAAAEHGFFWPPDPTSAAVCTVGGNLAYNSAGPRAVKYGTPRENTLGLRAVTAAGETLRCGVHTSKGVVGYDLTRLLIGSEGTLAVITEAILKLTPLPEMKRTLRAVYRDIHCAARAITRIMAQGHTPCALEFIDGQAIEMIRDYSAADLPEAAGALLMIEVDGSAACLDQAEKSVASAAQVDGLLAWHAAQNALEVEQLWQTRKALSPALRKIAPKKINEDVVVPVSNIPALIDGLERLGRRYGLPIVNFGHAGNGNIHVNLLVDPDVPQQMQQASACLDAIFDLVLQLEGTLSGEHGVGLEKRDYIERELDPTSLRLMHAIKAQFDPNNILNTGKTLPPEK